MVGALAPLLKRPGSVRGCKGTTTFDNILDPGRPKNLPEPSDPVNEGWVTK